jgi:hypothetical protein
VSREDLEIYIGVSLISIVILLYIILGGAICLR